MALVWYQASEPYPLQSSVIAEIEGMAEQLGRVGPVRTESRQLWRGGRRAGRLNEGLELTTRRMTECRTG